MKTQKTPCVLLLELVEQRIEQLDAFNRRDAHDLDVLMHCREKLKVAARTAVGDDGDGYLATVSSDICALGHPDIVQAALATHFDVV